VGDSQTRLFEAHTVHARVLYAFFFQGRSKLDDVVCERLRHRLASQAAETRADPALRSLREWGKEIAHLSFGRLARKTEADRQWAFWDITQAIIDVMNIWLADTPEYVREALLDYIRDYSRQVETLACA